MPDKYGHVFRNNVATTGILGAMDAVEGALIGGVLFPFALNTIKASAGFGYMRRISSLQNIFNFGPGVSGKVSGIAQAIPAFAGQTVGGVTNIAARGALRSAGGYAVGLAKGLPYAVGGVGKALSGIAKASIRKVPQRATGYQSGMFGYQIRPVAGNLAVGGLVAGSFVHGAVTAYDSIARDYAVNGPTPEQGSMLAPGAVNPSYSPITNESLPSRYRQDIPDNMGATPDVVFASHSLRNRGWLR